MANGSLILDSLLSSGETGESGSGGNYSDINDSTLLEDSYGIHADKISDEDGVSTGLRLPKYFQAILTLVVCGLLLMGTLGFIKQARKLCQKSSCARNVPMIRVDSAKDGTNNGLDSVLIKGQENKSNQQSGNGSNNSRAGHIHFDYYSSSPVSSAAQGEGSSTTVDPKGPIGKDHHLNLDGSKRVRFIRRASGPYSDEAIDYVQETYKSTAESKYKPTSTNSHKSKDSIRKPSPNPQ